MRANLRLGQGPSKNDDCGKVKQWNTQGICLPVVEYERKRNTEAAARAVDGW